MVCPDGGQICGRNVGIRETKTFFDSTSIPSTHFLSYGWKIFLLNWNVFLYFEMLKGFITTFSVDLWYFNRCSKNPWWQYSDFLGEPLYKNFLWKNVRNPRTMTILTTPTPLVGCRCYFNNLLLGSFFRNVSCLLFLGALFIAFNGSVYK